MREMNRRGFLVAAAGAAVAACRGGASPSEPSSTGAADAAREAEAKRVPTESAPTSPARTPVSMVVPKGMSQRTLLEGTPSETFAVIRHSGVRGNTVVALGGVHGNEPGGWTAADEVANWEPAAGSLIVVPRANVQAITGFVRTTEEIGDLNRFYPGNLESAFLMERMAATIVDICREFEANLLLDMHESWAFYREYPGTGTGALGQTITTGVGPMQTTFGEQLMAKVNPAFSEREQMLIRNGSPFARPGTATPGQTNRGRSSLSAGGYVPTLTPVLVEMGQENQAVERRVQLHLATARAALELVGVL